MSRLDCDQDDIDCLIGKSASKVQDAFTEQNGWLNPPCRDGCQISPAVDGKVLEASLGAMSATARNVPTLSGFCQDDGADFIFMDVTVSSSNMS